MRFARLISPWLLAAVAVGCGGSSSPTAPTATTTTSSTSTTSTTTTTTGTTGSTTPAASPCTAFGGKQVTIGRTTATFSAAPFNASELTLITIGLDTNDPRFTYQWVKEGGRAQIYAPADGVFVRIRHKTPNSQFNIEDWDLFFLLACDPARPTERDTLVRFNHITDPRANFKAAYAFGSLPAPQVEPTFNEYEERQVPTSNIVVKAGELLGSTTGTPVAHDFDFMIAVNNVTVCPFDVLSEPHASLLRALLGPGPKVTTTNVPQAGYSCRGFGDKP